MNDLKKLERQLKKAERQYVLWDWKDQLKWWQLHNNVLALKLKICQLKTKLNWGVPVVD